MKENTVEPTYVDDISLKKEHPVLWKYNEPQGELYYSSQSKNKYEILGLLWEAHQSIFNNLRPLSQFINYCIKEDGDLLFLKDKNGLLARGPEKLLSIFKEKVEKHLKTKYIATFKSEENNYKVLFVDENFIICDSVTVEEIKLTNCSN